MAEREKLIELKDLQITFGSGKKKGEGITTPQPNVTIPKGSTGDKFFFLFETTPLLYI